MRYFERITVFETHSKVSFQHYEQHTFSKLNPIIIKKPEFSGELGFNSVHSFDNVSYFFRFFGFLFEGTEERHVQYQEVEIQF